MHMHTSAPRHHALNVGIPLPLVERGERSARRRYRIMFPQGPRVDLIVRRAYRAAAALRRKAESLPPTRQRSVGAHPGDPERSRFLVDEGTPARASEVGPAQESNRPSNASIHADRSHAYFVLGKFRYRVPSARYGTSTWKS